MNGCNYQPESNQSNTNKKATDVERQQVVDLLLANSMPPLPVSPPQDAYKYPLIKEPNKFGAHCPVSPNFQPLPAFTGKNPSYLDIKGIGHLIRHQKFQNELPNQETLRKWFTNPANGIGTLGGGVGGYIWIDIDVKQFESQTICDQAFHNLLEAYPQLKASWLEQTHSGGYRIGVKVRDKPGFTNFALSPGGKHVGEALGEGRFTVLAPTIGPSGQPYRNINRAIPVEVDNLESIGIFSTKQKIIQQTTPHIEAVPGIISLEALSTEQVRAILNGDNPFGDRSQSLTKAIKEWLGWENWCHEHGVNIATSKDAVALAHEAASNLGIDAARAERILKSINSAECQPAASYKGGDYSCWKKIYRLDRATFEEKCPQPLKNEIIASWRKAEPGLRFFPVVADNDWTRVDHYNWEVRDITVESLIYENIFDSGQGYWRTVNDTFYRYTQKGYWQKISDKQVLQLIASALKLAYKHKKKGEADYCFFTETKKRSTFQLCRDALDSKSESVPHLRAFRNCTVDLRSGEVLPHDPQNFLTSVIDTDYEPNQQCPEVFHQFIITAFGVDLVEAVRAYTNLLLDPTAPYGKFIHLIGPSGSGKGTLLRFWGEMFGLQHYRSGDFSNLASAEERHQYLTGATLFAIPDTGGFIRGLKAFYELVDNGPMCGRSLFSSNGYEKIWNTKFVIASVDHLTVENSGDGWERRCLMLPTLARAAAEDPSLGARLSALKGQVISWALSMPRADRDHIILEQTQNERLLNLKHDATVFGDPVKAFADMCLRPQPGGRVEHHELHTWFESFCAVHGYARRGFNSFISHLKTIIPQFYVARRRSTLKEDLERGNISPYWRDIAPLPGLFQTKEEGLGPLPQAQVWCKKSVCKEGGLFLICEFLRKTKLIPTASDLRDLRDLRGDGYNPPPQRSGTSSGTENVREPSLTTPNQGFQDCGSGTENVREPQSDGYNPPPQRSGTGSGTENVRDLRGDGYNPPPQRSGTENVREPNLTTPNQEFQDCGLGTENVRDLSLTTPNQGFQDCGLGTENVPEPQSDGYNPPPQRSGTENVRDPSLTTPNQGFQNCGSGRSRRSGPFQEFAEKSENPELFKNSHEPEVEINWVSTENLQDIAEALQNCGFDLLQQLREVWPAPAINAAAKLLSPVRQTEISGWGVVPHLQPSLRVKVGNHHGVLVSQTKNGKWWIKWDGMPSSLAKIHGLPPAGAIEASRIQPA